MRRQSWESRSAEGVGWGGGGNWRLRHVFFSSTGPTNLWQNIYNGAEVLSASTCMTDLWADKQKTTTTTKKKLKIMGGCPFAPPPPPPVAPQRLIFNEYSQIVLHEVVLSVCIVYVFSFFTFECINAQKDVAFSDFITFSILIFFLR